MKRYTYRGKCGKFQVSGEVDLPNTSLKSCEWAALVIAQREQISRGLIADEVEPITIAFVQKLGPALWAVLSLV